VLSACVNFSNIHRLIKENITVKIEIQNFMYFRSRILLTKLTTTKNLQLKIINISDWKIKRDGRQIDFNTIDAESLNFKLRIFYAEAQPKIHEKNSSRVNRGSGKRKP